MKKHKNLLFCGFVSCIVVSVIIALLAGIHHRVYRSPIPAQITASAPSQSLVALTFDDGPDCLYTPEVLDILYKHQVPATFFLIGEHISGNELLVKEMAASGHEIGCHTFSHPDLTMLSELQIKQEVSRTEKELKRILPDCSIRYLRPPYGRYTEEVEKAADLPLMLWTIDSGDWENPDSEKIYNTVVGNIQDGDIIVFHDDNRETVKALEKIIVELKTRGFKFVTVSHMSEIKQNSSIQ